MAGLPANPQIPEHSVTIDEIVAHFTDDGVPFSRMAEVVGPFQREYNPVYREFCRTFPKSPNAFGPYLPVEAFKLAPVTTFPAAEAERTFESSGTGLHARSRHYVKDLSLYDRSILAHFELVFAPGPFHLVAHLPRYSEQGARSSLLYMADLLISRYGASSSGFFLSDTSILRQAIRESESGGRRLLLLGAAFGLLALAERSDITLPESALVIETGGMKTYRREISRDELHETLANGFGVARERIWSEYGMCELLSQCYTRGGTVFYPPPWMHVAIVDKDDPGKLAPEGVQGGIAIFDLANIHSVSAILTQDVGRMVEDGFEVLGRIKGSELRGCNFLVEASI